MTICIIPARGGSTRIPRKNIRDFFGKPIMVRAIETAMESRLFDNITVSTEDAEIADIAINAGANVYYRDGDDAGDDIGTQVRAKQVLDYLNVRPEVVTCVLYATSPLLTPTVLRHAYHEFLTIIMRKRYLYSIDDEFNDAGCFYFGLAKSFRDEWKLRGNSDGYVLPPHMICDINTHEDWDRAEAQFIKNQGGVSEH